MSKILTAEELQKRHDDLSRLRVRDPRSSDAEFSVTKWQEDVAKGRTRDGYWEWAHWMIGVSNFAHKICSE